MVGIPQFIIYEDEIEAEEVMSEFNSDMTYEDEKLMMQMDMRTLMWNKKKQKWDYNAVHLEGIDYYILPNKIV